MGINWGGIADGFTGGLTDFDKQGSSGWFGDSDWGGYTDAELYQPDWPEYENGGYSTWDSDSDQTTWGKVGDVDWLQDYVGKMGPSGTQSPVAPSASPRSFSSATAPAGSFSGGASYGSGGANRIGSWYVDPGSGPMLAEAMIRQKYTPLQRTWHKESYGPGGGSGGGSSTGDAIKGLAGKAIGLVGDKILGSFM